MLENVMIDPFESGPQFTGEFAREFRRPLYEVAIPVKIHENFYGSAIDSKTLFSYLQRLLLKQMMIQNTLYFLD